MSYYESAGEDCYERYQNSGAYRAAVQARIQAASCRKNLKVWLVAHPDNQRVYDWLNSLGEFEQTYDSVRDRYVSHPACMGIFSGDFGSFILDLSKRLDQWGKLSDKQSEILRNALARQLKWLDEKNAKLEERNSAGGVGEFVGTVGERREFTIMMTKIRCFDSMYGVTTIHIGTDENGNTIVHKGTGWGTEEGATIKIKATIKAHEVRNGYKQTVVTRAKVL